MLNAYDSINQCCTASYMGFRCHHWRRSSCASYLRLQGIAGPRASGPAAAEDQQTTGTIVTASGPTIASTGPLGSAAAAALLGPNSICVADLKVKNIHALRILFNCAYRLADVLGSSWVLVVEVLCILDRAIPAGGQGSKVGLEYGTYSGGQPGACCM